MEKKEFIILPEFTSLANGLKYIKTNNINISFSVNGGIFSSNSIKIDVPNNSTIIPIDGIYIDIYDNPMPGQLYIDNDFLKYYKEN